MAIFDKLKAKLDSNKGGSDNSFADNAACALPLGPESVIRYRQQRGVNLGERTDAQRLIVRVSDSATFFRCMVRQRTMARHRPLHQRSQPPAQRFCRRKRRKDPPFTYLYSVLIPIPP